MGIFGPEIRRIEGEDFTLESETPDKSAADNFATMVRSYNYKARIKPTMNGNQTIFQVWVSVLPSGNQAPVQQQK